METAGTSLDPGCELCEAARLTEWFYDDDTCYVAECESCFVPMIVLRAHVELPSPDVISMLHQRLLDVVTAAFDGEVWIDDNRRSIPSHYHAHARPRRPGGLTRRNLAP